MKNNLEEYLSYFFKPGISTIISDTASELSEYYHWLCNYILHNSNTTLITDNDNFYCHNTIKVSELNEKMIKDILVNLKNQNVFISIPIQLWKFENDMFGQSGKSRRIQNILRIIQQISQDNNLSIIIIGQGYRTGFNNTSFNNTSFDNIPSGIAYTSSMVVRYVNEQLDIIKCRWNIDNIVFTEKEFKQVFLKEYRKKKLERILK